MGLIEFVYNMLEVLVIENDGDLVYDVLEVFEDV